MKASTYSISETLRDGRSVKIRALRPEDRRAFASAAGRISAKSLYRRFFGPKRGFTEKETDFFVNVDFLNHVALVAVADEDGRATIIGAGRYILAQPWQAEVAFSVVDKYQGLGIGAALLRHLTRIARERGLKQLTAEVLTENTPMLTVFRKCGCRMTTSARAGVVHVTLQLEESGL
jgi:RimJ/RimL family protein N-acetyltransferase